MRFLRHVLTLLFIFKMMKKNHDVGDYTSNIIYEKYRWVVGIYVPTMAPKRPTTSWSQNVLLSSRRQNVPPSHGAKTSWRQKNLAPKRQRQIGGAKTAAPKSRSPLSAKPAVGYG